MSVIPKLSAAFACRLPKQAGAIIAACTFFAATVAAPHALARVELVNEVHKVDRYVDDEGRVQRRLVAPNRVIPGDELRYSVRFTNVGAEPVDAGSVVITLSLIHI